MSKYLKLFETVADYTAAESTLVKPNVSLIEETNKVEYNPYIPERYIIYKASEKLNKTWDNETATFGATIKSHTFENGVGTIEFNDNVTSIGGGAFTQCINLTSITIPNSVTSIGNSAFSQCTNLTSITIPNSVTSIGVAVFHECSNLVMIDVESGNIKYDSRDNCNAIVETATNTLIIGCQNTTIPNTVTSIGESAFQGCTNLTSITIPDSVTGIGQYAFSYCSNLTSITIPDSVTGIRAYAFGFCTKLISVTVESTTPPSLGSRAFSNNANDRKIYVPAASVNTYKSASKWSSYADDIQAIPAA